MIKKVLLLLVILFVLVGCKKEKTEPKEVWLEVEVVGYEEKPYVIEGNKNIKYYIIVETTDDIKYLVHVRTGGLFFDTDYYYPLNTKINVEKGDLLKYDG